MPNIQRKCSFCASYDHNVTHCRSTEIDTFMEEFRSVYFQLLSNRIRDHIISLFIQTKIHVARVAVIRMINPLMKWKQIYKLQLHELKSIFLAHGEATYCFCKRITITQTADNLGNTVSNCAICANDPISSISMLNCGHKFCFGCISKWANILQSDSKTCPLCRETITTVTMSVLKNRSA